MDILNQLALIAQNHAQMQEVIAQAKRLADPETARLIGELSAQLDQQMAGLQQTVPGAVQSFTADMRRLESHALATQVEAQRQTAQLDAVQPVPVPEPPSVPKLQTIPVDPRLADRLREELLKHHGLWQSPDK